MKSLQTAAFLVVCAFIFMGAKCEWFPDDETASDTESETVVIIAADVLANIQSIDAVNDEMDVLTTGADGMVLTLDLPTTPALAVDDLVEITITFEGVNDEYHITDVVFVQLL